MDTEIVESTTESTENLQYVQSKIIRFDKTWVIENYEQYARYTSPIFSIGRNEKKLKWKIIVTEGDDVWPTLYLLPCKISKMTVNHTFSLLNADGEEVFTLPTVSNEIDAACVAIGTTEFWDEAGWFEKEYIFDDTKRLLHKGNLTLLCHVELCVDKNFNLLPIDLPIIEVPTCDLVDKIGNLLATQKFSDFTINVGGEKFPVHKNVLSVRSPVFEAMFDLEMAEKQGNQASVTDVEPEVFKELLLFIYTGRTSTNIDKMADKLLVAANKYLLERLKVMCEKALLANMAVDNAAEILIFADLHNAQLLKIHAMDFIALNMWEVTQTAGFKDKLISHAGLITEILQAVTMR